MRNVRFYEVGEDLRIEIRPTRDRNLVEDRLATAADKETYRKELAAFEAAKAPAPKPKPKRTRKPASTAKKVKK
jgi:hypothetical protein